MCAFGSSWQAFSITVTLDDDGPKCTLPDVCAQYAQAANSDEAWPGPCHIQEVDIAHCLRLKMNVSGLSTLTFDTSCAHKVSKNTAWRLGQAVTLSFLIDYPLGIVPYSR